MAREYDPHHLTGAYALDALPEYEIRAVEAHLRQCPPCARETAEFRETAARLGAAASEAPPAVLRRRIGRRLARSRQLPPPRRRPLAGRTPALLRGVLDWAARRPDR